MKKIFILIISITFIWACSESSTGNDDNNGDTNNYVSGDIQDETTYFNFSSNTGTATEVGEWDIAFTTVPYVQFIGCQSQPLLEPIITLANGITAVRIDAASLDDVTEIPLSGFEVDDSSEAPFIGHSWLDESNLVTNEVYAIKTCSENYALVQFVDYFYTGGPLHQVENIKWKVKFNNDGSMDFNSTEIDSFTAANAYTDKQYYSFLNGGVTENEQSDIIVDEYSIWSGINTSLKKLNTTDISSVSSITDDNWNADKGPEYVTLSWYDYSGPPNHVLTPKDYVYVVNTSDGKYAAFEIMSYYFEEENGVFTINWKYLD